VAASDIPDRLAVAGELAMEEGRQFWRHLTVLYSTARREALARRAFPARRTLALMVARLAAIEPSG
jgi:hypothetical protein